MKRGKYLLMTVCMIFCISVLTICGLSSKAEAKAEYMIRFSSNDGANAFKTSPMNIAIIKFIDEVKEKSNGRMEVKLFTGGALATSAEEVIGGMQTGAFEAANWALGNFGEYTDAFMPMNLPYLFTSSEGVYKFVDGPIGQKMKAKLLKDTNIKMLSFLDIGFRHVTNNIRVIRTPDDMKGLKIRTMTDKFQMAGMESLGAIATPISWSELFTSLQQKVVDAQENPITNIYDARFYEVQKYLSLTSHNYGFSSIIISNQYFENLPADLQKVVTDAARNAELYCRKIKDEKEKQMLDEMKDKMEITTLTPEELKLFQEKAKSVWPQIKDAIGAEYYDEIVKEVESL